MKAMLKDRTLLLTVDSEQDISLELGLLMDKVEFLKRYLVSVWYSDVREKV